MSLNISFKKLLSSTVFLLLGIVLLAGTVFANAPATPTNSSPTDTAIGQSTTPTLSSSAYVNTDDAYVTADSILDSSGSSHLTGRNLDAGDFQTTVNAGGVSSSALYIGSVDEGVFRDSPSFESDTSAGGRSFSMWVRFNALPTGGVNGGLLLAGLGNDDTLAYQPLFTLNVWTRASYTGARFGLLTREDMGGSVSNLSGLYGTTELLTSTWYHVVWTVDGTSTKIYVDGVLNTTSTWVNSDEGEWWGDQLMSGAKKFTIGNYYRQNAYADGACDCYYDEVTLWDTELDATDITNLYNSGTPNNPTAHAEAASLASYWKLGEEFEQAASQWQVSTTSGNYTTPTFDSGEDATNLASIGVTPALVAGTTYYWHVRYKDVTGNWGAYSTETSFTTGVTSSLAYSGSTFTEDASNTGATSTVVTATLTGDTFVVPGGVMTENTHYTVSGVPANLTAVVTGTSTTTATITLTGTATAHATADDVSGLNVTFLAAAYTSGVAASNSVKTDYIVDFNDPASIVWSSSFTEATANDGTVTGTRVATLTNDTFINASGTLTAVTDYAVTNLPSNLTVASAAVNAGGTEVTFTLTGTALAHAHANDVADLTFTFNASAFTGNTVATNVTNYTDTAGVIDFADPASISYSGTFTEAAANDGTMSGSIVATLTGDIFNATITEATHVVTTNEPSPMTVVATRDSDTQVTFTLTGTTTAHADANDISNLTITWQDGAFQNNATASNVTNYIKNDGVVNFDDPASISWIFNNTEIAANDGSFGSATTSTLTGDTFVNPGGTLVKDTHYSVANLPSGLNVVNSVSVSGNLVLFQLTGNADNHNDADDVSDLTITFLDGAFVNTTTASNVVNYLNNAITIDFIDPTITYTSGAFTESGSNNGSIAAADTITLAGDDFVVTSGNLTGSGTHYTINNLPAGLGETLAVDATGKIVTLTLTGTATSHLPANDISNLEIIFTDAAFTNSTASEVSTSTKSDITVSFIDLGISYTSGAFTEATANDGSMAATDTITLVGDDFTVTSANLTGSGTHYTINNLPAGLAETLAVDATGNIVTLTLSGTATAHANANDISNLEIIFTNAAFVGGSAAAVNGSTKSDISIDFADPASISYSGTFTEAGVNDGSVTGSIVATLTGDLFNATVTEATEVVTTNFPAGMAVTATRDSDTQVTFTLTGNATNHNTADDVANLTITWQDGAFQNTPTAANVTNYIKNDGVVDFGDATLVYGSGSFAEASANDGSITATDTITLSGDTFITTGGTLLGGFYTINNVPVGLNEVLTVDGTGKIITLSFIGNAVGHTNSYDKSNLEIIFANGAFVGGDASMVTNSTKSDIIIDFADPVSSGSGGGGTSRAVITAITNQQNEITEKEIEICESGFGISRTLRQGNRGSDVSELQRTLSAIGFSVGAADGSFGGLTDAGVRKFQSTYGISVDGVVGPQTRALIIDSYCEGVSVSVEQAEVEVSVEIDEEVVGKVEACEVNNLITRTLRRGNKGADVTYFQVLMNSLGLDVGVVDGEYGRLALGAVSKFQSAQLLQIDGVFGSQTRSKLFQVYCDDLQ